MTTQLLRIATAGSVDDGKSTLIGRLLHDTDSLPTRPSGGRHRRGGRRRPRRAVRRPARRARAGHHHRRGLPVLLDRDAQLHPGRHAWPRALHPQHVHRRVQRPRRDPARGRPRRSAAADPQARAHRKAVGHQALRRAVNKIDLVDFDQARFAEVEDELQQVAARLGGADMTVIPIAAKHGDNVVHRSDRTPWYEGPTLLEYLEKRGAVGAATGGGQAAAAGAVGVAADRRAAPPLHRPAFRRARCRSATRSSAFPRAPGRP